MDKIITDESMRELRLHGTSDFPFKYYYEDVSDFDKHHIEYHWHNEFEWCMIDKGTADCLINSNCITLYEGDGIFINSQIIHSFKSENKAIMPNILFSPELIAPDFSAVYSEYVLPVLKSDNAYVVLKKTNEKENQILQDLKTIFDLSSKENKSKIDIQIAVCSLWRDFIRETDGYWNNKQSVQSMLIQSRIRTMIEFITKNHTEKLTLEEIALSANISKSEALRCFHEAIQTTPIKYLIDYRLNQAKHFLVSTNDTVTQIALKTGFESISYFIRIFKNEFGMTPKEFRLRHKSAI